jgi:hypothetical protein
MASVSKQVNALPSKREVAALRALVEDMRLDLDALRTQLNAHVHSGVTAGGANTGAPTTSAAALRTTA